MGDVIKFRAGKRPLGPKRPPSSAPVDGRLIYAVGSPWRKQMQRLERKERAAAKALEKATLARLDGSLMAEGSRWDAQLQARGWAALLGLVARWIAEEFRIGLEPATDLAQLGRFVNLELLCLPVSDPHRCVAEEYADGVMTLAEVHGFLTMGEGHGWCGVRCAGLPEDYVVEAPPRFHVADDGSVQMRPGRDTWASHVPGWFHAKLKTPGFVTVSGL
jgi:hypothetical protein